MSEYKIPGVYIEEVQEGSKPIEGVSTSCAGFVLTSLWGNIMGVLDEQTVSN